MFPLETRNIFKQEKQNVLGKKGDTKTTHTDQETVTLLTNYTNCLVILTNRMLNTKFNIIIKENRENTPCCWQAVLTTCPGLETLTPHNEETPNTLIAPRCFAWFRAC